MYTIKQETSHYSSFLILENASKTTKAVISLQEGARIATLIVSNKTIIKELPNFSYADSHAASLL